METAAQMKAAIYGRYTKRSEFRVDGKEFFDAVVRAVLRHSKYDPYSRDIRETEMRNRR